MPVTPLAPCDQHPTFVCTLPTPLLAGWAYSEQLVRVLEEYRRRFGWLWAGLEREATPGAQEPVMAFLGVWRLGCAQLPSLVCLHQQHLLAESGGRSCHLPRPCPLLAPAGELHLADLLPDLAHEQQLEQVGGWGKTSLFACGDHFNRLPCPASTCA